MPLTPTARRRRTVQRVLEDTKGQSPEVQAKALEAVIPRPTAPTADRLWVFLVGGLTLTIVISACAVLALLLTGTSTEAMITVLTTVFAGLIGLFAGRQMGPAESPGYQALSPSRNGR